MDISSEITTRGDPCRALVHVSILWDRDFDFGGEPGFYECSLNVLESWESGFEKSPIIS
ncbi:hypothetical protein HanIR_Chr03g0106631 [Helianthus annuus]|nr:hypothetical protein HanIR_Chr03g0106631 [Helianthus annuus]